MITVDNYEVETCGNPDTITEDLKALVEYFTDSILVDLETLIIQEFKKRDAKNNTSN